MYKNIVMEEKKQGFSQQETKFNNTVLLFNLIRKNEPVSRGKLAKNTGLSATTVSFLVEKLIERGLVYEKYDESISITGRPPKYLYVNGGGAYFFIVELLEKRYDCLLYNLCAEQIEINKVPISLGNELNIQKTMIRMLEKYKIASSNLLGINFIYPGRVGDNDNFISSTVTQISTESLENNIRNIKKMFPDMLIKVNNISSIYSYSELCIGENPKSARQMTLLISEGISSALVGTNAKGECAYYFPVEVGHIIIDMDGKKCMCGNKGCFDAMCNVIEIIKTVNKGVGLDLEYDIYYESEVNSASLRKIASLLDSGNLAVIESIKPIIHMMAVGLASIINANQPDYLYISGSAINLGEKMLELLREELNGFVLNNVSGNIDLVFSRVDKETKRVGAVYMLMNSVFSFYTSYFNN